MTLPPSSTDPALRIYLTLAQYPIMRTYIRERMREVLFGHKIISPQNFEAEVREQAIHSQKREGLENPFVEEPPEVWETRLDRVRNHLTDFYFAYNLPYELFEDIVRDVLSERQAGMEQVLVSFNAELAPQSMLLEQGLAIENLPAEEQHKYVHRLQEIKVVLIRTMISDQLGYVRIAKDWFTVEDLHWIAQRKIGHGKIGGKAAGMLLAYRILNEVADEEVKVHLTIPESHFLGADLMYTYMAYNDLMHWMDQKYKPEDQIRQEYLRIQQEYRAGKFPPDIEERLRELLATVGNKPLIVRSSSLLEDNFGTSFAGKYESYFCPNQGSFEENLRAFTQAIAAVYASALGPDPLLYRRSKGLQDYDERIAILIQDVQGEQYGRYFLPQVGGVAFGRNYYRWAPQIRREDGFLRIVWGLGTRAVERVGRDYPRLVALSHPQLRPEASPEAVRHYSQQFVDLIDLKENTFKTMPVKSVLRSNYPPLRYMAQIYQEGYLKSIRSRLIVRDSGEFVITMDELLKRTPLARRMRTMLKLLEERYQLPVDMEFTARVMDSTGQQPEVEVCILQCRPQSQPQEEMGINKPAFLPREDIIFTTRRLVPHGQVSGIEYVLFVDPETYFLLPTPRKKLDLRRLVSHLNRLLADTVFICVGPGRWGTANPDLGVCVGYSDIYNTRALIEITGQGMGMAPEPSFGTHFFQDLVEEQIYPLGIYLDDPDVIFNREFFYHTPNRLLKFMPGEAAMAKCLRLIEVASFRPAHRLELVMDDEEGQAVAYLVPAREVQQQDVYNLSEK